MPIGKRLKVALQEVEEEKTRPIEELIRVLKEIDAQSEKRKTKIDSTTLIREYTERPN